jgi:Ca2+/Na+ antiporter
MQSGCATVCCREYGDDLAIARITGRALIMTENLLYTERVSSKRTEMLFVVLTLLFFTLLIWRVTVRGLDILALVFLCLCAFFFFYVLNYRTLTVRLTTRSLKLTFGIFTWNVPLDNIESCRLDEIPVLMRMGGAGIHFMLIRRRYRASFNFLEYPRVVIAFKRKVGPVRDISFSTRHPDDLLRLLQDALSINDLDSNLHQVR